MNNNQAQSSSNQSTAAEQLAEYRRRQQSIRGTNQNQASAAVIPDRSAFEDFQQLEEAGDKEVIDISEAEAIQPAREQTEYEKMIEAQMRMYPNGF